MSIDRRQFLQSTAAFGALIALPVPLAAAEQRRARQIDLTPSVFTTALDPASPVLTGVLQNLLNLVFCNLVAINVRLVGLGVDVVADFHS